MEIDVGRDWLMYLMMNKDTRLRAESHTDWSTGTLLVTAELSVLEGRNYVCVARAIGKTLHDAMARLQEDYHRPEG